MALRLPDSTTVLPTISNMRCLISAIALLFILPVHAKEMRDTVWTHQNDKIILTYNVTHDNGQISIDFSAPRIIPTLSSPSTLGKACKGEIDKLKVVVFDRVGDFDKVRWTGMCPTAFMVPSGLSYDNTCDGYYILGESLPIEFRNDSQDDVEIKMPLYIAVYEKKQKYSIVSACKQPLSVSTAIEPGKSTGRKPSDRQGSRTEKIAVTSIEEQDSDNGDITSVLSSIDMVKELLGRETEYPFSQTMQMEIYNLRSMKNQIKEPEIIDRINEVLLLYSDKERELKESQNQAVLAAKAQEQALIQQQKQEAEAQQKAAEEKAREQEEKQQKRTLWMIIGGVILAIFGFIGNAVFKHFRDVSNQKSIMQMQDSLARQAEHEAGRRSREIIRNKAHQAANKGRSGLRSAVDDISKNNASRKPKSNKRRSI